MPDESLAAAAAPADSFSPTPGEEFASGGEIGSTPSSGDSGSSGVADLGSPQDGAPTSGTGPGTPAPDATLLSVTDFLRQQGLYESLPETARGNDYAAMQELARRAQEADTLRQRMEQQNFYARLGQSMEPHVAPFQQYLQQQKQPKTPERQPWEPPTDRATVDKYIQFCDRDPNTGLYASKPGIPPEYGKVVNEYQDYMQGFLSNPAQMISQAAEHIAAKTFDQRFEQRYQELQQRQQVDQILQENSSWLYQRGPDGQPVRQGNQPVFSPAGVAYTAALRDLRSAGVSNPAQMNAIAIQMVRGQMYAAQAAQAQTAAAVAPAQQRALLSGQPNVNPLQALDPISRSQTPGATEPSTEGMSFREATLAMMRQQGITDNDFGPEDFSPK